MTVTTTTWHRLEPRVRGTDPAVGLAARVHDPLWLLGRQWQLGELLGEDAAFPIAVRVETAEHRLTRFATADGTISDYDPDRTPLEVVVEREPQTVLPLRLRLDAWTRLAALMDGAGLGQQLSALAVAHPLPPARAGEDRSDARLRLFAADAGDGAAIADALRHDPAGLPADLIVEFLGWYATQTAANAHDCWVTDRLEHRFRVSAMVDDAETVLAADGYSGGRLDWYSVDLDTDPTHTLTAPATPATTSVAHLLPTRVMFPGMPAERFWELEDAAVNFGAVTAAPEDLGRLLAVEYATVFGNDWWSIPVPARFGSLISVSSLVVRDTFGESILLQPTERAAATATAPWRMFRQTDPKLAAGSGPAPELLLLAPVVAGSLEGDAVEEVLLLRDEMANMAWAVERVVEGADGRPRNRSIEYGTQLTAAPLPEIASPADLVYLLQTHVPEHWIPLLAVRDPANPTATSAVMLQRGALLTQDGQARPITAQGTILRPDQSPWYLHEEEVPSAGLRVNRTPAVARWIDGTRFAWMSRRASAGRGEGSSGLRFDLAISPVEQSP